MRGSAREKRGWRDECWGGHFGVLRVVGMAGRDDGYYSDEEKESCVFGVRESGWTGAREGRLV